MTIFGTHILQKFLLSPVYSIFFM